MKMTIEYPGSEFSVPGQYAIITTDGPEYERVYPVCEFDSKRFTIVFRTDTSDAAKELAILETGDEVKVQTGLGNGYDVDAIPDGAYLVADADGIPQMLGLMRELLVRGKAYSLILGYSTKDRVFMLDTFRNLCNNIEILTADGSNGRQGKADDAIRNAEYVCAAGSVEMLDRLAAKSRSGQFNLDGMNITKW